MSVETFRGDPIAPGLAVGPLQFGVQGSWAPPVAVVPGEPTDELGRFRRTVDALERDIEGAVHRLESETFHAEAQIMRTHLDMLRDPELHRQVLDLVQDCHHRAETAVEQVLGAMAAMIGYAEDPVLAERAADLRDLASRLTAGLTGAHADPQRIAEGAVKGAVLALPELLPSVVLAAWEAGAAGFVVEYGTTVSHAAILAKSFGMPVVRVGSIESVRPFAGRKVLVWGDGEVLVEPSESELAARRPSADSAPVPRIAGAVPTRLWVSIVDPGQLETLDWTGLAGVGLYRSEALFLRYREDFPNEREQFEAYRKLFRLAGNRPVVFRTLDLGADKAVEHMRFGPQENPCLGLRAHRLFRFHPEILITQIRAVLRAAHGRHRLSLMYPMIANLEQLRFVRALVDKAMQSLADDGLAFQRDVRHGVLIETPSAAWAFARLLEEVDFASVGTNDLVQYLFAVERNAANVADLYQPEHPVVLQVIRTLAEQAAAVGKPLSVCGEMAADPALLPVLAGLGVTDVSVVPGASDALRRVLASCDGAWCRDLAEQCLQADSVEDVRTLLGRTSGADAEVPTLCQGEALDPVCGMVVHVRDTPYLLRVGGVAHYFCSRSCLNHFVSGSSPHGGM
ncbi:MAG: phosphoenolpyruvate--protein phosphotransferase [Chromatiaceae bacterium]